MLALLKRLNRYTIMATGDFEKIFADFEVPSCPEVVTRLLRMVREPDTPIEEVSSLIQSDPGLSSQLLKMVNSALFGLPGTVSSVNKAVSFVGLKEIGSLAVSYAMTKTVRSPDLDGFDLQVFWRHSLLRAVVARELAARIGAEPDDAFTAGLMQDIALPILLTDWFDVYKKVYFRWKEGRAALHKIEEDELSWTHAQAGAWIAREWGLPDILVCAIGLHVLSMDDLREMELLESVVGAAAAASDAPKALDSDEEMKKLTRFAKELGLNENEVAESVSNGSEIVEELAKELGI